MYTARTPSTAVVALEGLEPRAIGDCARATPLQLSRTSGAAMKVRAANQFCRGSLQFFIQILGGGIRPVSVLADLPALQGFNERTRSTLGKRLKRSMRYETLISQMTE
jgi:hypothetical protein